MSGPKIKNGYIVVRHSVWDETGRRHQTSKCFGKAGDKKAMAEAWKFYSDYKRKRSLGIKPGKKVKHSTLTFTQLAQLYVDYKKSYKNHNYEKCCTAENRHILKYNPEF